MRQLLLMAALGICGCSENFHSVGFYNRVDTMLAAGKTALVVGTGDLNGDGRADVVFADNTNAINVLISKGDGNFSAGVSYPIEGFNNRTLAVGDLNGDGRADVVVGTLDQQHVQVFMNQGDGRLVSLQPTTQGTSCKPAYLVLHDMTGDGRPDLVVGCIDPHEIHILKNQAAAAGSTQPLSFGGMYTHKWTIATSQGGDPQTQGIAVGELNGDGVPDIAVATNLDLRILNSPKEPGKDYKDYQVSVPLSTPASAVALGDISGNGTTDIAALQDGKSVQVFEYATGGAYNQVAVYQNLGINGRTFPQTLKVADLSSDGKSDLLLALQNPSELKVAVSRGETGMVPTPVTLSYQYPQNELQLGDNSVTLGDINGDGKLDLVLRNNAKIAVLISASQ